MASETLTFLQNWVFTKFAFPFLLVFFVVFGILEKTKVLGEGKKQLDALTAFVIALIFVSVAYPVLVVNNLVLFLTVAIIVVFVALLLWGFVSGSEKVEIKSTGLKWVFGIVVIFTVIIAVLWATGTKNSVFDFLFNQSWSGGFWTNVLFIIVVAVALAVVIKSSK